MTREAASSTTKAVSRRQILLDLKKLSDAEPPWTLERGLRGAWEVKCKCGWKALYCPDENTFSNMTALDKAKNGIRAHMRGAIHGAKK
jgi:hypothetical protein